MMIMKSIRLVESDPQSRQRAGALQDASRNCPPLRTGAAFGARQFSAALV